MPKYVNRSISILEVGGKAYEPNSVMDLTDAQVKNDATVDWWIRSGFIVPEAKAADTPAVSQVAFIPTDEEMRQGRVMELTEPGTTPVAEPPAKTKG